MSRSGCPWASSVAAAARRRRPSRSPSARSPQPGVPPALPPSLSGAGYNPHYIEMRVFIVPAALLTGCLWGLAA